MQIHTLLNGVDCLRAALEQLNEVDCMQVEDGEQSILNEVLIRVLQHGTADGNRASARDRSNWLDIPSAMVTEIMVEEIRSEVLEDAAYECMYGNFAVWRNCTT